MPEWSARDKLKEIERELVLRNKLYPRWIQQNALTIKTAQKQIGILKAIADDYRERIHRDQDLLDLERAEKDL